MINTLLVLCQMTRNEFLFKIAFLVECEMFCEAISYIIREIPNVIIKAIIIVHCFDYFAHYHHHESL